MSEQAPLPLSPTPRSTVNRYPHRAADHRQVLYNVLDSGLICHVGFIAENTPVVMPSVYGRDGDTLYFHASRAARSARIFAEGAPICVTVTHLDGIVYARDVAHNSVNYRSAMIYGTGRALVEEADKLTGLHVMAGHMAPGAWDYGNRPDSRDLLRVAVMCLDLSEASVKIRNEPPSNHGKEPDLQKWAGVLPVQTRFGVPQPQGDVPPDLAVPDHIAQRRMTP